MKRESTISEKDFLLFFACAEELRIALLKNLNATWNVDSPEYKQVPKRSNIMFCLLSGSVFLQSRRAPLTLFQYKLTKY